MIEEAPNYNSPTQFDHVAGETCSLGGGMDTARRAVPLGAELRRSKEQEGRCARFCFVVGELWTAVRREESGRRKKQAGKTESSC